MKHQLVGFHDFDPWDATHRRLVGLQVEVFDRPPVRGDIAEVGRWDPDTESFCPLGETTAWNFPQGARQQWIRSTGEIIFNVAIDGDWRAVAIDPDSSRIREFERSVYAVDPSSRAIYGLNFARLHRLGGYGYVGLPDVTKADPAPPGDGIWRTDLLTGRSSLLVSLADVAALPGVSVPPREAGHYVTHILANPAGTHLAFLHRYWLADGGIQTRLLTCGADGTGLECRAEGFLSHFDWMDGERLLIWGRVADALQQARASGLLSHPAIRSVLRVAKPLVRGVLRRGGALGGNYLVIGPAGTPVEKVAPKILTEDGHPSFDPVARQILLTDTYPDPEGWRRLFLVALSTDDVRDLARHRQAQITPDASRLAEAADGIDAGVLRAFSKEHFTYSRSGIHCDFHPRWRSDARAVCYDSNHEGSRRIYVQEV